MKKRILSVILALCLCISYQPTAYAAQEESAQSEESSTEESKEDAGTGEGGDIVSQEPLTQSEENSVEESAEDAGAGEGGDTALPETSAQPEESSLEETAKEAENSRDMDTELQEIQRQSEDLLMKRPMIRPAARDVTDLSPAAVYRAMIALKDQEQYKEGTTWTNTEPYSDSGYCWKGGPLDGTNISAVGCVAFAFILSDAAFGNLQARMYPAGGFTYNDIKVGDILQVNSGAHTVIVLEVVDTGVVVAEGNYNDKVHWERTIAKEEVMSSTSHYITRYPENYVWPDAPDADTTLDSGTLREGLTWKLTNAGTLTISGSGPMPEFSGTQEQPWNQYSGKIRKVVIGDGVTRIGSCAFWNCELFSAQISSSVTTIGNSAFRGSKIMSVTIPSSVKTIGDSAFQACQGLSSVTVSDGVETICQNAFRACTSLKSISLPASIGEVGAAAFLECTEMTSATFASSSKQVKMGDNMFTKCWKLMSVKLPQNIDCIGDGMFQNCGMLAGVEIPQGAERIGSQAFASCSGMSVVVIPDSVTMIGTAAFSACPLKDIYFTGTEEQWSGISKIGDTASAVSKATMHYNYTPSANPNPDTNPNPDIDPNLDSDEGDNSDNGSRDHSENDHNGDNNGNNSDGEDLDESTLDAAVWKPTTPDEIKRYRCVGKEDVRYTLPTDNVYPIDVENSVQGPLCFQAFEFVLGEYTIGRTYNIYALSDTTYSTDQEVQITLEIPTALYQKSRDYKMICVTKGGLPIVYDDLDSNPETITIKTNKYYAYALIYK